jgi:hypothetical protein
MLVYALAYLISKTSRVGFNHREGARHACIGTTKVVRDNLFLNTVIGGLFSDWVHRICTRRTRA